MLMLRRCVPTLLLACGVAVTIAFAEEPLPVRGDEDSDALDIEPPLLLGVDGKMLNPPGAAAAAVPGDPAAPGDPEQIATALERAKKNAAAGDRLYRAGIISKVQAEDRALKVVRLERDLAQARLGVAKETLEALRQAGGEGVAKPRLDEAAADVAHAEEAAKIAAANLERAEVKAARANVQRQQKLLALGSGRKADVHRAQEKLSALTQPENRN